MHGQPNLVTDAANDGDTAELLVLQRCCWVAEAIANGTLDIPPLHETHDEVREWVRSWTVLTVRDGPRLVAAVRGRLVGGTWEIGRLMVAPDLAGQGIGRELLAHIERLAPTDTATFELFTGARSTRNINLYERAGYRMLDSSSAVPPGHIVGAIVLRKSAST
ncbi:GNAT family N-acetyltransferase [Williamsia sp. 1135]|uniref:GNAT family N-acetyltransferase n=1 Tax=Williamsia sp. 1135 TaxID=1889262 RepID=UPI000A107B54|nr:GNAT family N-acetyltransferase [Williamsia sp. 1135]ORM37903.1 tRNA (guanine-N1)-methyltransferase [Williamsia sp. 1135]